MMMRPAEPRPPKLAELIADQLRGQIIRRELADGEFLPVEAELCAHFETSRPTMREAFRILETEGLLTIRRGGRYGPQVRAPRAEIAARNLGLLLQYRDVDLGAVYDAFLDIVPRGARRLAENHGADDLARLRAQRERCAEAVGDPTAFLDASTRFNLLLVELGGNPVMALLAQLLADVLQGHREAMSAFLRATPRVQARRASEVLDRTAKTILMIEAGDVAVERLVHDALDDLMRKALQVPLERAVQLV